MTELSKKSTIQQKCTFIGLTGIGTAAILRNLMRLFRYTRSYSNLNNLMRRQSDIQEVVSILEGGNNKKLVLLETISPNFSNHYFSGINDSKQYQAKIGKFYQKLYFQSGFQGIFRFKGKDYRLHFNMNRPIVGFQVAHAAQQFQKAGVKFHRNQMISVCGELRYQKDLKRSVVDTKMLCLDRIQMQKYWEMNILATIISSFYFSILLGISLNLYCQSLSFDEKWLIQLKQHMQKYVERRKKDEYINKDQIK